MAEAYTAYLWEIGSWFYFKKIGEVTKKDGTSVIVLEEDIGIELEEVEEIGLDKIVGPEVTEGEM